MYTTQVTGKQIIDAMNAGHVICLRIYENNYVSLGNLASYEYVDENSPCSFVFYIAFNYIIFSSSDANTPLTGQIPK